jgi:hypothetical protein
MQHVKTQPLPRYTLNVTKTNIQKILMLDNLKYQRYSQQCHRHVLRLNVLLNKIAQRAVKICLCG